MWSMGEQRRYYSQNGEDYVLWRFFDDKASGFFVDVGAFDGAFLSNSLSFEQQGWSGICVEPTPKFFEYCQSRRPHSVCLNVACVGDDQVTSVDFKVEKLGLTSGIGVDAQDSGLRNLYRSVQTDFDGFDTLTVPARTLNSILGEHLPPGCEIDFISLDVEGAELDVLRGLDLVRYAPKVLVVEANTPEEAALLNTYLVTDNGYIQARAEKWNYFYVRRDQDVDKLRRIKIHCTLEQQTHPVVTSFSLPARTIRPAYGLRSAAKQMLRRLGKS
jgi:FkbM family methyltransferase